MAIPTSDVDIINAALLAIGENTISSREETVDRARAADELYDSVLEDLLSQFGWTFAKRRIALALQSTDPLYGWSYGYGIPSDKVLLLQVAQKNEIDLTIVRPTVSTAWAVEGDSIRTNFEDAYALYVYRNDRVANWPGYFVSAMTFTLAEGLALKITGNVTKGQIVAAKAREKLAMAKTTDRQQRTDDKMPKNRYVSARF